MIYKKINKSPPPRFCSKLSTLALHSFARFFIVALLLCFSAIFLFTGCEKDKDETRETSLTKENYSEYLNIQVQFENYSTSENQVSMSFIEYTAIATAKIIISRKSNNSFNNAKIDFVLNILPFTQSNNGLSPQGSILISYDGLGETTIQISASRLTSAPELPSISQNSITIKSVEGEVLAL